MFLHHGYFFSRSQPIPPCEFLSSRRYLSPFIISPEVVFFQRTAKWCLGSSGKVRCVRRITWATVELFAGWISGIWWKIIKGFASSKKMGHQRIKKINKFSAKIMRIFVSISLLQCKMQHFAFWRAIGLMGGVSSTSCTFLAPGESSCPRPQTIWLIWNIFLCWIPFLGLRTWNYLSTSEHFFFFFYNFKRFFFINGNNWCHIRNDGLFF